MPPPAHENQTFLRRAHRFLVYFGGAYAAFLLLLLLPAFQSHVIFLHKLRWPLNADFERPEKYGIAPRRALNVHITTADGVRLGAWFIFAEPFYQDARRGNASSSPGGAVATATNTTTTTAPSPQSAVSAALRTHPTVLHFHGNGGTRAVPFRIVTYAAYTARLRANVLALDYRGFADSGGAPSEQGLVLDARAAWDWAVARGARAQDLVLVGQSLGTGVVAQLARELAGEGTRPRGVVLNAPYSSLRTLLETYELFGWIPLLRPLQTIPMAQNLILRFLKTKFDTQAVLPDVKTDIVLVHAKDDLEIPLSHSEALFDTLLEPLLPPPAMAAEELQRHAHDHEKWAEWVSGEERRQLARDALVRVEDVDRFGKLSRFRRAGAGGDKVVFVESLWGGHNRVAGFEGVIDAIGRELSMD